MNELTYTIYSKRDVRSSESGILQCTNKAPIWSRIRENTIIRRGKSKSQDNRSGSNFGIKHVKFGEQISEVFALMNKKATLCIINLQTQEVP